MKSPRNPPAKDLKMFDAWLEHMPASLEYLEVLAPQVADRLDFSPASLDALEGFLLQKFPTFESFESVPTAEWDAYGRYVGEVFRRVLGGQWELYWDRPSNVHHNRPVILGYPGQQVATDPHGLTHVSLDRRTGNFLSGILERQRELRTKNVNDISGLQDPEA